MTCGLHRLKLQTTFRILFALLQGGGEKIPLQYEEPLPVGFLIPLGLVKCLIPGLPSSIFVYKMRRALTLGGNPSASNDFLAAFPAHSKSVNPSSSFQLFIAGRSDVWLNAKLQCALFLLFNENLRAEVSGGQTKTLKKLLYRK